ncbi:unnamed protein product [Vitrella brassicaformis CCMP3155]|uniref:Carrier domain-containing protein n=1 Tax=Vitrella brassicaformis (strain CCMP3155) TaxID=1169540 RepID=A0A0G4FFX1_VITBC|nr:unnamed protein product [Vitrella brassicaformis CCMP3155]|eukprot:CEM11755.1 unnamed protein product [Vitrella brassicaformis CCMP3155]
MPLGVAVAAKAESALPDMPKATSKTTTTAAGSPPCPSPSSSLLPPLAQPSSDSSSSIRRESSPHPPAHQRPAEPSEPAGLYDFYAEGCWWPCGDGAPTEVPEDGPAIRRLISYWARVQPSVNAVRFLKVDGSVESAISYQELHRRAEALGRQLLLLVDRGQDGKPATVLLCYPPGIDFIVAFFACLYSGVVAVPVYPPDPSKLSTDLPRFTRIASTVKAQACLTNNFYQRILHGLNCKLTLHSHCPSSMAAHLHTPPASAHSGHTPPPAAKENELTDEVRKEWRNLRWFSSQELIDRASKNGHGPSLPPLPSHIPHTQVAFLQFTSGSTNHPKGVMVSHGNLLHNTHLCVANYAFDPRDDYRTKHDLRKDSGGEADGSEEPFVPLYDRPMRDFVRWWYKRQIQCRSVLGQNIRSFSWLPVYHDMGLIGLVGGTLFFGSELIMMSPLDFVRRPWLWLQGMTKWQCHATAAPNFAYDLVSRKTPEDIRKSLDLSKVAGFLCGAEPLRYSSIKNFIDTFREVGVRPSTFLPAFGLAENTLVATGRRPTLDTEPLVLSINALEIEINGNVRIEEEWYGFGPSWTEGSERKIIIGNRLPVNDTTVAIVDSSTHQPLPEGHVGEVWLSSPSMAQGYLGLAEQTRQTFQATLSGTTNAPKHEGPFLRTGDTGFLYKGELFIAGRAKDMIIVRGRKYIPQDIEEAIEAKCDVVRPGCCAAFPVDSEQGEGMGIACELRPEKVKALTMAAGKSDMDDDTLLSKRGARRQGGFDRFVSMLACTTDRCGDKDAVLRTIAQEVVRAASMKVGLPVQQIWLLKPRVLPKTTSGKMQRSKAKQMLQRSRANGKGGVMWCEDLCTAAAPADTVKIKYTPRNAPSPSTDASTRSLSTATPSSFLSSTDTKSPSSVQPTSPTDSFRPSSTNDTGRTALADALASVAHSVVGGEERPSPVGRLLDLGLDSIGMTEFREHVRRMTGIDLPPSCMFDNPSLDALAGQLVGKREQEGVMDPIAPFSTAATNPDSSGVSATDDGTRKRDPETDVNKVAKSFKFDVASLPALPPHPPRKSRHVLVTDATSAVGRFLTVALLQAKEQLTVHCLVQTNSDEEGLRQVREACQEAGIWKDEYQSRLMIVPGHVTRRHLGLKPNHLAEHFFAELCERIDLVFHTGFANGQSFMQSYDRLRENTFAMKEIVRLCTTSKLKPLHFVSSLTLFPEYVLGQGKELREATTLDTKRLREVCPPEQFGLPWTNWSTEQVLKKARARGLPCTIYRVPSGMTSLMTGYVDERHAKEQLTVHCLVQTNSDEEGLRQVREACQEAGIWNDEYQSRLMIVPGHVTRRHLGLKPNHLAEHFFAELCERIDLVFHTGFTNGQSFMQSYDRLRENTFAMKEIVRLCTTSKLKPLHFVSSLTLFPEFVLGHGKELREASTLDTKRLREVSPPEQFGLPWTNWSTEQVLKKARARGLPCTIYRVPSGMTSLMTGYVDERDVGGAMMMAMLQEGEMPPVVTAPLGGTPVDVVAAMMARLCLTENRRHWVYHLANPQLITNSERERWLGDLGVPMKPVSMDQFLATIKKRGAASPLYPLMPLVQRFTSHWCPTHEPREHLMISTAHLQEDLRRAEWPSAHDVFTSCVALAGERGRARVSPRALKRAIAASRQLSILTRVDEGDEE